MGKQHILQEYYARYLTEVRNSSESTVRHYYDALNNISRRLKEKGLITETIYEVESLERLFELRDLLYADEDFIDLNTRGKRMYSAGLNNYCRFASGDHFFEAREKIKVLDVPMVPEKSASSSRSSWKRSNIIRTQAIELAGYECELDHAHHSFLAEKTHKPYMEGHHALPMSLQEYFTNSLDVYANVICLCPICHRRIHHGLKDDRIQMLNQIYVMRSDRLSNCGIKLSKEEFSDLVMSV